MFPKENKLSESEFKYIYEKGFRAKGRFGVLIALKPLDSTIFKVGFVVNKKIGDAVARHLMTRRLRSLFRKEIEKAPLPYLFQYIAYKAPNSYPELEEDFQTQYSQILNHFEV